MVRPPTIEAKLLFEAAILLFFRYLAHIKLRALGCGGIDLGTSIVGGHGSIKCSSVPLRPVNAGWLNNRHTRSNSPAFSTRPLSVSGGGVTVMSF